jgi:hypothetical protein
MTDDICTMAREVHTLLIAAHPHAGDTNLARAAELATAAIEPDGSGDKTLQHETLLAIQTARKTIESGAGAADGEEHLLEAVRAAEQWVRGTCAH